MCQCPPELHHFFKSIDQLSEELSSAANFQLSQRDLVLKHLHLQSERQELALKEADHELSRLRNANLQILDRSCSSRQRQTASEVTAGVYAPNTRESRNSNHFGADNSRMGDASHRQDSLRVDRHSTMARAEPVRIPLRASTANVSTHTKTSSTHNGFKEPLPSLHRSRQTMSRPYGRQQGPENAYRSDRAAIINSSGPGQDTARNTSWKASQVPTFVQSSENTRSRLSFSPYARPPTNNQVDKITSRIGVPPALPVQKGSQQFPIQKPLTSGYFSGFRQEARDIAVNQRTPGRISSGPIELRYREPMQPIGRNPFPGGRSATSAKFMNQSRQEAGSASSVFAAGQKRFPHVAQDGTGRDRSLFTHRSRPT